MSMNIREQLNTKGYDSIDKLSGEISDSLNVEGEMDQADLLRLQQQMSEYTARLSLMTTIFKTLADTEKEIIRNC